MKIDIKKFKIVLDCGNGATYHIAPTLFWELGCETISINDRPDGRTINKKCGAVDTKDLSKKILSTKADIGFAFDGDGDRLVLVEKNGKILDGDDLLYALISNNSLDTDKKPYQGIVGTLMTNKSLELFLEREEKKGLV